MAFEESVDLVDSLRLQDLSLHGSTFTYFSSVPSGARSHFHRFLISSDARDWIHNVVQKVVFRLISDHIPIVLSIGQLSYSSRPFKFFNTWCNDRDLQSLVSNVWQELQNRPSCLWCKFNKLRYRVKSWQSDRYASSVARSRKCEPELTTLL